MKPTIERVGSRDILDRDVLCLARLNSDVYGEIVDSKCVLLVGDIVNLDGEGGSR